MTRCRGWLSLIPCRTCGSDSIKGSPPYCTQCRTYRRQGEALRCEQPLELGGTHCETCTYPTSGRSRVLVSTTADA